MGIKARLDKLERERGRPEQFMAVVNVSGMTEQEAEAAVKAKELEAERAGYRGRIMVLDL